jgi:hypothetical protein
MTGGPSGRYHAGSACVWQNTNAVSTAGWEAWDPRTSPGPLEASRLGDLYRASYGANVAHGGHVTTLGGRLANDLLAPWLAGGARGGLGFGALGIDEAALAFLAAAFGTAGLAFYLLR